MHSLAETSTIHLGIKNDKKESKKREEELKSEDSDGCLLSEHSQNHSGAENAFGKGKDAAENKRAELQESQVQKSQVTAYNQRGPHRVHQLEDARKEEHCSKEKGGDFIYDSHTLV